MNETTIDLDQADEKILTHDVADEALEAAAGTEGRDFWTYHHSVNFNGSCYRC